MRDEHWVMAYHALKKIADWERENDLCNTCCLIIGTSKQSVQFLARALRVPHYHSELTIREKCKVFKDWVNGEHKVMVGTTGCGTGINLAELKMVMNVGAPYDAMTLIQNIGSVNRDGSPDIAYLYVTEEPSIRFVKEAEDIRRINVLRRGGGKNVLMGSVNSIQRWETSDETSQRAVEAVMGGIWKTSGVNVGEIMDRDGI
ncbi:P-loop containing nucleoside triphosphate hydrolase protein [Hysterangium stoloniferum]|nr:P-loop containing nucleoside triphosphate hydrolase protein [Hysterangium stoloniferum]